MKKFIREITWLAGLSHGWGNGYVLIPKGHILHGKDYSDIDVEVHGGLTYSGEVTEDMLSEWELDKNTLGYWCVGFDTAHYADTLTNWTKAKVQKETDNLMKQLKNYKP